MAWSFCSDVALTFRRAVERSVLRLPTAISRISKVPSRSMISSRIFGRINESRICPLTWTVSETMIPLPPPRSLGSSDRGPDSVATESGPLSEDPRDRGGGKGIMVSETVQVSGHILDSLILPKILDEIIDLDGTFEILEIAVGKRKTDLSTARLKVSATSEQKLQAILKG